MSVASVSSNNYFTAFSPAAFSNNFQLIQQDFQQLGQDLQSGNLSQAQSEFSALQQLLPSGQQTANGVSNAAGGSQSANSVSQAIAQLGSDLQSGNLSAAQTDFAALQDFQQQGSVFTHRFHHLANGKPIIENPSSQQNNPATLLGELGQQLQSGNLASAQQTYSALQQDFQEFISGNGSSGFSVASSASLANGSLNISA